jgi:hypothetical protein
MSNPMLRTPRVLAANSCTAPVEQPRTVMCAWAVAARLLPTLLLLTGDAWAAGDGTPPSGDESGVPGAALIESASSIDATAGCPASAAYALQLTPATSAPAPV